MGRTIVSAEDIHWSVYRVHSIRKGIGLQLSCVHGLMCQLHATVMRMIPTVYGPPRHNMVHLVNFKWIYMRLSFSVYSVEKAL